MKAAQEDTCVMLKRYEDHAMDPEEELIALCKELEKDGNKNAEIVRFLDDAINAFSTARGCLGHARRRFARMHRETWEGLSKGVRRQILNLDDGKLGGRHRAHLVKLGLLEPIHNDGLTDKGRAVAEYGRSQS